VADTQPRNALVFVNKAQFESFVVANTTLIPAPLLSICAFRQLIDAKHLAGYQKGKDRGTFQPCVIDKFHLEYPELGEFFRQHRSTVESCVGGIIINDFANINSGKRARRAWHSDHPTRTYDRAMPNTGRVLTYYASAGQQGRLRVRFRDQYETAITVPSGSTFCFPLFCCCCAVIPRYMLH
jgi:hypothetical protein